MKKYIKEISYSNILLSLVSFVFILSALEVYVRLFNPVPFVTQYGNNVSDKYLPYKPKPFSVIAGTALTGEYSYHYQHNSFGFRDVEHTVYKEQDTYRILGLGDSFTYGIGVGFEETYLYLLETMLNDDVDISLNVEVIKAGIPRYYPETQRILLDKYGRNYEPDLIIIGFLPNDIVDTHFGLDAVVLDRSGYLKTKVANDFGRFGDFIYRNSHFVRIVLQKLTSYRMTQIYDPRLEEIYVADGHHEDDWEKVQDEYINIFTIADEIGAKVLLVHIPSKGPWTEDSSYPSSRLGVLAQMYDIGFVDVLPSMQRESLNKSLYYDIDGHTTSNGHKVIADEIHSYLMDWEFINIIDD